MTSNVMPSIVKMDRSELNEWFAEVRETLATDIEMPRAKAKTFGIVDLWNIQRNMNSANRPFSKKRNAIRGYVHP